MRNLCPGVFDSNPVISWLVTDFWRGNECVYYLTKLAQQVIPEEGCIGKSAESIKSLAQASLIFLSSFFTFFLNIIYLNSKLHNLLKIALAELPELEAYW